jgi:MAP3K TRAFs-binding domain
MWSAFERCEAPMNAGRGSSHADSRAKPLCFVAMPFGTKPDAAGGTVDFDAVYSELIAPAISAAGLEPLRADEEMGGGIIHKPMFERLILCEYAVADLTSANANVFYELGVRHALRPFTTVLLFAHGGRLAFDVASLRAVPYRLAPDGRPTDVESARSVLTDRLIQAQGATDSPVFQLVEGLPTPQLDHTKTDVFRERVRYSAEVKERLAEARTKGATAVHAVEDDLQPLDKAEAGVVVDLFLSYRAVESWKDMIRLVDEMTPPLAATVLVQEQLALALNRDEQSERAERVLRSLLERQGPSSETFGLLGRVYKDRWRAAAARGEKALAEGALRQAIETYLQGFESDWRDAYPGINALTLMELQERPDPRAEQLRPIVAYAVERRLASGGEDYWDVATRLELAVLARDDAAANEALADALANVRESWEPKSTANNLGDIREARAARGESLAWANQAEEALRERAKQLANR